METAEIYQKDSAFESAAIRKEFIFDKDSIRTANSKFDSIVGGT